MYFWAGQAHEEEWLVTTKAMPYIHLLYPRRAMNTHHDSVPFLKGFKIYKFCQSCIFLILIVCMCFDEHCALWMPPHIPLVQAVAFLWLLYFCKDIYKKVTQVTVMLVLTICFLHKSCIYSSQSSIPVCLQPLW